MRKVTALIFMLVMFLYLSSGAIELESSQFELNVESLKSGGADYLESPEFFAQEEAFDFEENNKSIYEYKYKSPKKAFLYSLMIPGLGQKYAGSGIIKSALFFVAEIGMWGGHFSNQSKGDDKTIEFKAYADSYWTEGDTTGGDYGVTPPIYPNLDPDTYRGWIRDNYDGTVNDDTTLFTEHLPSTKSQQYYEMIGKYQQFAAGWDDFIDDTTVTAHRSYYMDMRKTANDYLDNAKNFITFSIVVHLVSAFDAAISANRHNKQIADDTWSVNAVMKSYTATEKIPVIKITHRF